jgi:hypothetical protein
MIIQEESETNNQENIAIGRENKELKEINDNQDINDINEQTGNMIPLTLEDQILELRERNAIINCILDQNG